MQFEIDHVKIDRQADLTLIEAAWQKIRQHLADERQQIFQEIRQYPPPIPACDVQFNGLLAERATILQELGHVEGILKQSLTVKDTSGLLDEFLLASHCVKGELAESIRQSLIKLPSSDRRMADTNS